MMNSLRRLTSSAFTRTISHTRQPMRSFVLTKIVPVAMGAAVFGMGCMGKSFHEPSFTFQNKRVSCCDSVFDLYPMSFLSLGSGACPVRQAVAWGKNHSGSVRDRFSHNTYPSADSPLTSVIAVGPPAFDHRTLSDDNPILLPLDPTEGADTENNQTEAARSIDYNTNPKPAVYGDQLVHRIEQERIEVSRLMAEQRERSSNEGQLEIRRRLVRLRSLYDAVWALHMIDISQDPEVWKLLDRNSSELNQPGPDTTRTLKKAQETIAVGDIRSLETHIMEVIQKNIRLGYPTRPASELERFMGRVPAGSAVLSRLRLLQKLAAEDTEESRLLVQDIMYGLWWVLERKARELDAVVRK